MAGVLRSHSCFPVRCRLLPTSLPVLPSFCGRIWLDRSGGWLEFLVPHPHIAVRGQTDEVNSRGAQRPSSMSRAVAQGWLFLPCVHGGGIGGGSGGRDASRSRASVILKSCVPRSLRLLRYGFGAVDQTQAPVISHTCPLPSSIPSWLHTHFSYFSRRKKTRSELSQGPMCLNDLHPSESPW